MTSTVGPDGVPGPGFGQESTTWAGAWKPDSSTKPSEFTWWPTSSTTARTTTTTRRTTTTTTTTRAPAISEDNEMIPGPVNTMPISIGSCANNGEFSRNPKDCETYYHCVFGEKQIVHCPSGLHWNDRSKVCDWPAGAKCKAINDPSVVTKKPPTTTTLHDEYEPETTTVKRKTTRMPTTTMKTTTVKPSRLPNSKTCNTNGAIYANPDDCETFYNCVNNKLVKNYCGPGKHFDETASKCGKASDVRCITASRYLKFIGKLGEVQLDDPCGGLDYASYPGKCDQYLLCLHGTLQAGNCADPLYWNPTTFNCDWPQNVKCNASAPVFNEHGDSSNEVIPSKPTTTTTKKPRPPHPSLPVKKHSGHYKLVCYFTNWAWYVHLKKTFTNSKKLCSLYNAN